MPSPDPLRRFLDSLEVTAENWRDGPSVDFAALDALNASEKLQAEGALLKRGVRDGPGIEALGRLDTPRARAALVEARKSPDLLIRLLAHLQGPEDVAGRERAIVDGLRAGQRMALLAAAKHGTSAVKAELLRAAREPLRDSSYDAAAALLVLAGELASLDDPRERGFLERFLRPDSPDRREAWEELRARVETAGGEAS
ncbi:MAG TPA: hypothetical protein VF950_09395 [Planctomycetota bacterium]